LFLFSADLKKKSFDCFCEIEKINFYIADAFKVAHINVFFLFKAHAK
jgi:hypothetical protein